MKAQQAVQKMAQDGEQVLVITAGRPLLQQGHTFSHLVQFATVGVMGRCLWPRRGPRRYAGGLSAIRYGCSLGYLLNAKAAIDTLVAKL